MKRKRLSESELFEGILRGDTLLLSRAITLVESTLERDRELAQRLIEKCLPYTGKSFRLGITGVPGVGKSTFIDSFGSYLTSLGRKIAILAIDPSSRSSRGSILGDKTRMDRLSHDPKAYIRPSPTAGQLGGVTQRTRENLLLCEAAGFDLIIIETVGVGQSETVVREMVDFFLLLMLPNAGDELQGIKKGIMEMADAIAINKADGKWMEKARLAKSFYSQALRLFPEKETGWKPQTFLCSGLEGSGLEDCWNILKTYREKTEANGSLQKMREKQAQNWFEDSLNLQLMAAFFSREDIKVKIASVKEDIRRKNRSPIEAAESLVREWLENK